MTIHILKDRPDPDASEILLLASKADWPVSTPQNPVLMDVSQSRRQLSIYAQGWPMRAFHATWDADARVLHHGTPWAYQNDKFVLAWHPRWTGLVVDVLFFAGITGLSEWGLAKGRGRLRRRAGKCPSCGYSRVGLSAEQVCPECGSRA
jgi:hypothetical protein